ncbi:MAG: hypothetical protein AB7P24_09370 [Nitrospira sp.]
MRALLIIVAAGLALSCGVVGSPVAPEYVGVAVTVEKQKRQQAIEAEHEAGELPGSELPLEGHDIGLPPSHPVGTR